MMSFPVWLPGPKCLPGGPCRGEGGRCPGRPPGTVKSGRYASYWNAFLLVQILFFSFWQREIQAREILSGGTVLELLDHVGEWHLNLSEYTVNYRLQRSCGKVMFLHASVILSTGGGWQSDTHPSRHPHPTGRQTPSRDGHCSGRYASYWNAFLLI